MSVPESASINQFGKLRGKKSLPTKQKYLLDPCRAI